MKNGKKKKQKKLQIFRILFYQIPYLFLQLLLSSNTLILLFHPNLRVSLHGWNLLKEKSQTKRETKFVGEEREEGETHKSDGHPKDTPAEYKTDEKIHPPPPPWQAGKGSRSGRLFSNNLLRARGEGELRRGFSGGGLLESAARTDTIAAINTGGRAEALTSPAEGPILYFISKTNSPRPDLLQERGEKNTPSRATTTPPPLPLLAFIRPMEK